MKKQKNSSCLGKMFKALFVLFVLAIIVGSNSNEAGTDTTAKTKPTSAPKATATLAPTTAPADEQEKPLEIVLKYPELGEYGSYYTFNENVEKAEESDKVTKIQCFVPAGDYILTNEGKYMACVYVYSKETVISEDGWEEAADCWVSPILKVGDTCEVTVPEGWYIYLQENNVFRLVQK